MTLLQAMGTLLFLALMGTLLVLLVLAALAFARRRGARALRLVALMAVLVFVYLVPVAAVSLASPRGERAPGAPVCFDDWCVAGEKLRPAAGPVAGCPAAGVWLVTLEVSSRAKRVTQRENAARAYVEDAAGRQHAPCGAALPEGGRVRALSDAVAPGDSFSLTLPFALPPGDTPVGAVVRHPYTPGVVILGDDEALFHRATLLRVSGP